MAVLLISHDLGVIGNVADRVALMYAGRIVETGAAAAMFCAYLRLRLRNEDDLFRLRVIKTTSKPHSLPIAV